MVISVHSIHLNGIEVLRTDVEISLARGLPGISIVGMPGEEVKESRDRIKTAILNAGLPFPNRKIIVNLSPSRKRSVCTHFDLPIAIGIIFAGAAEKISHLDQYILVGGLSLSGAINPINGIVPLVCYAREVGLHILIPSGNIREIAMIDQVAVFGTKNLNECLQFIKSGSKKTTVHIGDLVNTDQVECTQPMAAPLVTQIFGQPLAKRAAEIAAAGRHNMLLMGEPGCGKSVLAKAVSQNQAPLPLEDSIETLKIYSISPGKQIDTPGFFQRPFRSPHARLSLAGLLGSFWHPGEASLAHHGILFLDEILEVNRNVIEALRTPLDLQLVEINRRWGTRVLPADFQMIAACNPCPCGFYESHTKPCQCSHNQIMEYRKRLSGPILDRIDVQVRMQRLPIKELIDHPRCEDPLDIKQRIARAFVIQKERNRIPTVGEKYPGRNYVLNSRLPHAWLNKYCFLDTESKQLIPHISTKYALSSRGIFQIVKLARSIADLSENASISAQNIVEAAILRCGLH